MCNDIILCAVCDLIEGIDVPAIEARIAEYQKENAEQIMVAQARKVHTLPVLAADFMSCAVPSGTHADFSVVKM